MPKRCARLWLAALPLTLRCSQLCEYRASTLQASDGLWDNVNAEKVGKLIGRSNSVRRSVGPRRVRGRSAVLDCWTKRLWWRLCLPAHRSTKSVHKLSQALLRECQGEVDDVTIVVVRLNNAA